MKKIQRMVLLFAVAMAAIGATTCVADEAILIFDGSIYKDLPSIQVTFRNEQDLTSEVWEIRKELLARKYFCIISSGYWRENWERDDEGRVVVPAVCARIVYE